MHEASIALSTLDAIKEIEKKEGIKANKITIEVGQGSGVNIDALSFCLTQIVEAENLNLIFEFIDKKIEGFCKECNKNITLTHLTYNCPICNNLSIDIVEGLELNIKEIEGEKVEG